MSAAGSAAGCASGAASSTTLPPTGPANTSAPGAAGQQPSGARAIIRRMCRSHAGRNTSSRSLRGEDGWRPTYTELEGRNMKRGHGKYRTLKAFGRMCSGRCFIVVPPPGPFRVIACCNANFSSITEVVLVCNKPTCACLPP